MCLELEAAPHRLQFEHSVLFSPLALKFMEELVSKFDEKVDRLMLKRARRRVDIFEGKWRPAFHNDHGSDLTWTIDDIPKRLQNRKLDLGDVTPSNTTNFVDSLYANVQGVQVNYLKNVYNNSSYANSSCLC